MRKKRQRKSLMVWEISGHRKALQKGQYRLMIIAMFFLLLAVIGLLYEVTA